MRALIAPEARARIRAAAARSAPVEACGLLLGRRRAGLVVIEAATEARNVAPEPRRAFEVDPAHLFAALRAARGPGAPAIVGVWHSHPSGLLCPSAADRAAALEPALLWVIAAPDGRLAAFRPDAATPRGFRPVALVEPGRIDLGGGSC